MAEMQPRWRIGVGAALVLVVGLVGGAVVTQQLGGSHEVALEVDGSGLADDEAVSEVMVDVQGAVARPGVYTLAEGARVLDAIAAAGGMLPEAAPESMNLARVVVDGEQLWVATQAEIDAQSAVQANGAPNGGAAGGAAGGGAGAAGGLVSINQADAATLETLPRIGPALAASIIAHREEHGPFASVDELDDVSGIGPALMSQLESLVTL